LRNKKNVHTKGIFSLLVGKNFARILWSIFVLVLLVGIMSSVFMPLANMPYFTLWVVRGKLIHEDFDRIDNFGITDGKGSFEIVDSDLKVIYPEGIEKNYTEDEISDIWEVDYLRAKVVKNQYTAGGVQFTEIICSGNDVYDGWFLLVDEGLSYVDSANFPDIKEQYSAADLEYYLNDLKYERGLYKHEFLTAKGQTYNMIIKYDSPAVLLDNSEINILIYTACGLALVFILFIILSVNSTSKRFKKPIKQLDEAMSRFYKGNYGDINLDHRGIREIKNVIDTFNIMVQKLKDSEDDNERLSREKQRLIADISHDLKTPITIIQGYTDALCQGRIPAEGHSDYLEKIQKKTEYLTQLINEFSYYSKIDFAKFELAMKNMDLSSVVRDFMAENYSYITDKGNEVLIDIPQEVYLCSIDSVHFKRCLENIISNFIKHNPVGTTIHVLVKDSVDSYNVFLENNGTPIDKLIVDKLFDPFVMGDKSRKTGGGSGLGLAVVKKIMNLHGGNIEYSSNQTYVNSFKLSLLK